MNVRLLVSQVYEGSVWPVGSTPPDVPSSTADRWVEDGVAEYIPDPVLLAEDVTVSVETADVPIPSQPKKAAK